MEHLSTDHTESYDQFKGFVCDNVQPDASEWDIQQEIPDEVLDTLREQGFFGGLVPKKYGGLGWDCLTYGLFNEALGRGSSSLTVLFTVQGMVTMSLLKWANEDQLERWMSYLASGKIGAFALTEPDVGSDINNIKTELSKSGDKFALNGTKKWITFGGKADVFLVFAKIEGKSVACIVPRDTEGVTVEPIKEMLGFKACSLATINFDNVIIDQDQIVGKPGFALSHIAPVGLHYGRISTSFSATGLIRACLEECTARSKSRMVANGPIRNIGMIKEMIADIGVDYTASMELCINAALSDQSGSHQSVNHALVAKYFSSRASVKSANNAVQIFGASGCHELSSPTARYYRDSKIMEIIEGSSQIHQDLLSDLWIKTYS
ncbi:MAG: acyl-CoA dehydrogenase family protein [Bacteroidota bacterium]